MSTLPQRIIELAGKAGFASELRVASTFAAGGWDVQQSVYFIDKDERKGRELDIYARKAFSHLSDKPEVTCSISLCVEVKKRLNLSSFLPGHVELTKVAKDLVYSIGSKTLTDMSSAMKTLSGPGRNANRREWLARAWRSKTKSLSRLSAVYYHQLRVRFTTRRRAMSDILMSHATFASSSP